MTLPRSPAWRCSSSGAPWSFPAGLKCGPANMKNPKLKILELNLITLVFSQVSWLSLDETQKKIKRVNLWVWKLPVDMQPFVVSPRAWTWKPWAPGLRPERLPVTVVGPKACKKQNNLNCQHDCHTHTPFNYCDVNESTISFLGEVYSAIYTLTAVKNDDSLHHCYMWSKQVIKPDLSI